MATSLSSSSYTLPYHLVKSIFCLRLRGFCSHHHLGRQVSSAGEAMEHGSSRTSQSCAMRRKGVTTHANSKHHLYPYAVQKPLIVAHWSGTYSITHLHSNLWYREDCGKKFALLPPGLTIIYFLIDFWFTQPHDISVLCNVMFPT